MEILRSFEIELHQPAIRRDASRVAQLLHPEFIEIGYSGTTWDFNSTLENIGLLPPQFVIWSQDFQFIEYAEAVVQLIYLSANVNEQGHLFRHAKRSSIWVREAAQWRMKYHQATAIDAFEKSKAAS